ncbi:phosphotransferase enzyme family protein [Pedobacter sp. ASV12]|uniref:phosphotransferase enzyme family protein n=1 Tax=Pedobacter sp. ASV12 TaxID=2795120 RepID=UPI0018EE0AE8|nr:phosphotransferase [Pedobacter sp. ASV12]
MIRLPTFNYSYICTIMDIFPTQYSTLAARALKDFLEQQYGFSQMKCRLLVHNVSDTYLLENDTEQYIFKIYRDAHRKLDEIKAEVELLNILKENGVSVSYPIKALDGEQIQSFNAAEGTRYGILLSYALGQPVYELNSQQLETLGTEMAKFHNLAGAIELKHPRKAYTIETTIKQPITVVKPAFEGMEEVYAQLVQMADQVSAQMEKLDLSNFSYGYCHFDFLPKNFHFQKNGELTFFDFDFAGQGYLINDITSFYIHYFLECFHNKISREEAEKSFALFVEAYRKVRLLSDEELATMPYFGFGFWVFYLGFQYENFDDWSSIFFGPNYLKQRVALIEKWLEWFRN